MIRNATRPGGVVTGTVEDIAAGPAPGAIYVTPAFWTTNRERVATFGAAVMVRLSPGAQIDDLSRLLDGLPVAVTADRGPGGDLIPATRRAVAIEAGSLLIVSVAIGLFASTLIGLVIVRRGMDDATTLAELGATRGELAAAGALEWGLVGVVAALVAVCVATAVSPLAPVGIARAAVPAAGFSMGPGLIAGALTIVAGFAASGAATGRLSSTGSPRRRPPRLSEPGRLRGFQAAGPVGAGARLVVLPGRAGEQRAVGATVAIAVVGIASVTAAATFGQSLHRLVATPTLRGWAWDYDVGNYADAASADRGLAELAKNDDVASSTGWQLDRVELGGLDVPLLLLDGPLGPTVIEGRLPRRDGEIALGRVTAAAAGQTIGGEVIVVGPSGEPVSFVIVGTTTGVSLFDPAARLDEGAVVTFGGAAEMISDDQNIDLYPAGHLVTLVDGRSAGDALARLRQQFPDAVEGPRTTSEIRNLDRVQWLPRAFAAAVAAVAALVTGEALTALVRRRERDLAVIRCLGATGRQLAAIIVLSGSVVGVTGLVVGVPTGLLIGRALWRQAAQQIGVPADVVVARATGLGVAGATLLIVAVASGRAIRSTFRTGTASLRRD